MPGAQSRAADQQEISWHVRSVSNIATQSRGEQFVQLHGLSNHKDLTILYVIRKIHITKTTCFLFHKY